MGRDDARAVPGLQGGTAPARAFAAFMRVAVAKRPVEPFETEVKLPEWQLEPDAEAYYGNTDQGAQPPLYDEQGNPVAPQARPYDNEAPPPEESGDRLDGAFIDRALGRARAPAPPSQHDPSAPSPPPPRDLARERLREQPAPDQSRP
jgi:penicillin-binding protein 1A